MVRIKNRYLLVNILYPSLEKSQDIPDIVALNQPTTNNLTSHALLKGLRSEVLFHFGEYGAGAIADSLSVKYLSPATSTFILRVARAHYKLVWAALTLMTTVPVEEGKRCVFRVIRVSGTIRKIEEEAIRRAQEIIDRARCVESNQNRFLDVKFGPRQMG